MMIMDDDGSKAPAWPGLFRYRMSHIPTGCSGRWGQGQAMTLNVLFICSQNRLRSPTAEQVFADWPGIETQSAGLGNDADIPVTPELLAWSDLIFVMEKVHRSKLSNRFGRHVKDKRIVCLDIPDDYDFMEPALVQLLTRKVTPFLPIH
jgi:predicted protein tyrosine phosphatase